MVHVWFFIALNRVLGVSSTVDTSTATIEIKINVLLSNEWPNSVILNKFHMVKSMSSEGFIITLFSCF